MIIPKFIFGTALVIYIVVREVVAWRTMKRIKKLEKQLSGLEVEEEPRQAI